MNIPIPHTVQHARLPVALNLYKKVATEIINEAAKNGEFLTVSAIQILPPSPELFTIVFYIREDEMALVRKQAQQAINQSLHLMNSAEGKCQNEDGHEFGTGGKCIHCGYMI